MCIFKAVYHKLVRLKNTGHWQVLISKKLFNEVIKPIWMGLQMMSFRTHQYECLESWKPHYIPLFDLIKVISLHLAQFYLMFQEMGGWTWLSFRFFLALTFSTNDYTNRFGSVKISISFLELLCKPEMLKKKRDIIRSLASPLVDPQPWSR